MKRNIDFATSIKLNSRAYIAIVLASETFPSLQALINKAGVSGYLQLTDFLHRMIPSPRESENPAGAAEFDC